MKIEMCSDDCDLTLSLNMMKRKSEGLQSARISKILFKELSDNYKYFLPGLGRDKVLFELWAEKFCPGPTHTFPSFRFYVWTNTLNTTINLQWEKPMESKYHRQLDRACIVWTPPNFRKLLSGLLSPWWRRRRSGMSRTPGAPGVLVRRTAALRAGITGSRKW